MVAASPTSPALRFNKLLEKIAQHLTTVLTKQHLRPQIHFELEGTVQLDSQVKTLDYAALNQALRSRGIPGSVKPEYWCNQWEYVSDFAGQIPLQEARYLQQVMYMLPELMCRFGARSVLLQPVSWQGDKGRYLQGSKEIFSLDTRSVHIPNAIQLNISVQDTHGNNLIASSGLGEWLQYQLLRRSLACCVLFLPEQDAFKRLQLRDDYGLDKELSSPVQLSGGHRGSVALYRQKGKHNQPMGQEPLLYAQDHSVLCYQHNWQKTARIEHRLGATSLAYNPLLNVIFALLALLDAIDCWRADTEAPLFTDCPLPISLYDQQGELGAYSLFAQDRWFDSAIDRHCQAMPGWYESLGEDIKTTFLQHIQRFSRS